MKLNATNQNRPPVSESKGGPHYTRYPHCKNVHTNSEQSYRDPSWPGFMVLMFTSKISVICVINFKRKSKFCHLSRIGKMHAWLKLTLLHKLFHIWYLLSPEYKLRQTEPHPTAEICFSWDLIYLSVAKVDSVNLRNKSNNVCGLVRLSESISQSHDDWSLFRNYQRFNNHRSGVQYVKR